MIKNRLAALEHPSPDTVNCANEVEFANIILWLEDQKIRHYKIEDRESLRAIGNSTDWSTKWKEAYDKYKQDIGVPKMETPIEEITWVLGYAVRLEYMDNADTYKTINAAQLNKEQQKTSNPTVASTNPFDVMDMSSKEFETGIRNLATKLNIPNHPNHLILLEAVASVLKSRIFHKPDLGFVEGTPFPIKTGDKCAYDDPNMDEAAKILRLLQIHSLRNLQTAINETIVSVQEVTANPKTDSKLGKVGF